SVPLRTTRHGAGSSAAEPAPPSALGPQGRVRRPPGKSGTRSSRETTSRAGRRGRHPLRRRMPPSLPPDPKTRRNRGLPVTPTERPQPRSESSPVLLCLADVSKDALRGQWHLGNPHRTYLAKGVFHGASDDGSRCYGPTFAHPFDAADGVGRGGLEVTCRDVGNVEGGREEIVHERG